MRTIQEIFDLTIASNHYVYHSFMCYSLNFARDFGIITAQEAALTARQIQAYIHPHPRMDDFIKHHKFKITPMDIYKDWANRPMPEEVIYEDVSGNI